MTDKASPPNPDRDDVLTSDQYRRLHDAARALGWTPPADEDDVNLAEQRQSFVATPLPETLRDPRAIFEGAASAAPPAGRGPTGRHDAIDANLARAAREGSAIPPEIEQRMRADRQAAEAAAGLARPAKPPKKAPPPDHDDATPNP